MSSTWSRRSVCSTPLNRPPVFGTGPSAILPAVEKRTGPNIPPIQAAGTDPAYVPGITSPDPAKAEETAEAVSEEAAELPPGQGDDVVEPRSEAESAEAVAEVEAETEAEAEGEGDTEAEADGPVFEVSDHRGSITANRGGITFRLDGETAEFRWDEIGAVEIDSPRFSRLFTVTVYTTSRRWFEAYVQASAKRLLKEWTAELDAVLDACFDDSQT
jgi:hypothetical protein